MNKFIANSTATYPIGTAAGQKCLVVSSGPYSGRMAILYASSASSIALVWADSPYTAFSSPVSIVTDAADFPFDAQINSNGDIYVAYTTSSGNDLNFVKLTFADGGWTTGTPVTVYDAQDSYYPSLCKLSTGQLWIAYSRVTGGSYYVSAKYSTNDGTSWGTVSDPGDTLTSGANAAYAKMVELNLTQYLFYSEGGNKVAYCPKANGNVVWGSEVLLASESGYNENLSVNVSSDGRIGVAYAAATGLKFREYTGSYWSGEFTVDSDVITNPSVLYRGGEARLIYSVNYGSNMNKVLYAEKSGNNFSTPAVLDGRRSDLVKLLVYSAAVGTYQDKTTQAASDTTADIFHSTSGAMLSAAGDTLFFGMDEPFNFLRFLLSTSGSGGEVIWKYWDGQAWKAFVPESGVWHFSTSDQDVLLWEDYVSIPVDWQKKAISGTTCYWVSVTVATVFTTAPVGSRINAVSNLKAFSVQV